MRVVLEVVDGPHAGQKILLRQGQVAKIGRTEYADFAFPHDRYMSSVHFAVECGNDGFRVRDLDSSNGTLVNGQRVQEAIAEDRSEIQAGQTRFVVHVQDTSPPAKPAIVRTVLLDDSTELPASAPLAPEPTPAGATPSADRVVEPQPTSPAPAPRPTAPAAPAVVASSLRPYQRAFEDESPSVRREALLAAAWTRQPWLLEHCRRLSERPAPESLAAVVLLAILGTPDDLDRFLAVGQAAEMGPRRFRALGAYGHPAVVPPLLSAIRSGDPPIAVAAGLAFTKITGADVESDTQVQLPPEEGEEPDDPDQIPGEAVLPSLELAQDHWSQTKSQLLRGTRFCRGFDLSRGVTAEILAELDMESRFEACLRARFAGTRTGSLVELEAFAPTGRS
ncbi:MAG: FHA domain-containing protein [Planctomycetota bacterium]|jgi:pSer/pThr/pTyr-binding forkhead associated (FHA) protein